MACISVSEAKALTNAKTSYEAFDKLYNRLAGRQWRRGGKVYTPAGMIWRGKFQEFHLTHTSALDNDTGVFHDRVKLPLDVALDCISGNF